ncbi:putative yir4 protein [Plasmodium yoelii yoelii]|uniref:Yir4 protein n=1 Tax=Plasmodium yoelii yoelii TaxID=73239 RepID=Q7RFI5_PLAYO|nr:putative yir4 protein [Plasmodium yoelii yoelii]
MNVEVCKRFKNVWDAFPDTLDKSKNYQFKDNNKFSNNYCNDIKLSDHLCNNISQSDLDKISAGCLYLLDEFIKDRNVVPSPAKNSINMVDYVLIWLSYMLNLKYSGEGNIITCFYSTYMNDCDKYNTGINELTDYDNYKKLLDEKNDVLNMDINIVSKFYEAFKLLCEIYTEFDEKKKDCTICSEKADKFVKIHKELNDPNHSEYSTYCQALSTLSNGYNNLKNEYKDYNLLPEINAKENNVQCPEKTSKQTYVTGSEQVYEEFSEVTLSESSLVSKLFIVLSIFGAIAIFLGISYKVNNMEFKNYFHYIYANFRKYIIRLTFYISIRYLDFGNDFKNKN